MKYLISSYDCPTAFWRILSDRYQNQRPRRRQNCHSLFLTTFHGLYQASSRFFHVHGDGEYHELQLASSTFLTFSGSLIPTVISGFLSVLGIQFSSCIKKTWVVCVTVTNSLCQCGQLSSFEIAICKFTRGSGIL